MLMKRLRKRSQIGINEAFIPARRISMQELDKVGKDTGLGRNGTAVLARANKIAQSTSQRPSDVTEEVWKHVVRRGFIDLYVLQPADPDKPNDPNRLEALRPGVEVVKDVDDFLDYVDWMCRGGKLLRHLRFGSHGSKDHFRIGNTWISINELRCQPDLAKKILSLRNYLFAGFSKITIDACYCGDGKALLIYMAAIWGVPVLSYFEAQGTEPLDQPTQGTGKARQCYPDGTCYVADRDNGSFTLDTDPITIPRLRPPEDCN